MDDHDGLRGHTDRLDNVWATDLAEVNRELSRLGLEPLDPRDERTQLISQWWGRDSEGLVSKRRKRQAKQQDTQGEYPEMTGVVKLLSEMAVATLHLHHLTGAQARSRVRKSAQVTRPHFGRASGSHHHR